MKNEEEKKELHTAGTPLDDEALEKTAGGLDGKDVWKLVEPIVITMPIGIIVSQNEKEEPEASKVIKGDHFPEVR